MQLHFNYFVGQVCLLLKQASSILWSQLASPLQHQADQERSGEAFDKEEANGRRFQPDLQETGVLNCDQMIVVQRELNLKRKPAL